MKEADNKEILRPLLKEKLQFDMMFNLTKNANVLIQQMESMRMQLKGYRVAAFKAEWIGNLRANFSGDEAAVLSTLLRLGMEETFDQIPLQNRIFEYDRIVYAILELPLHAVETVHTFCETSCELGCRVYKSKVFCGVSGFYSDQRYLRTARIEADRDLRIQMNRQIEPKFSKRTFSDLRRNMTEGVYFKQLNEAVGQGMDISEKGTEIARIIRMMPDANLVLPVIVDEMIDLIRICDKTYIDADILITDLKRQINEIYGAQTAMDISRVFQNMCHSIEAFAMQTEFGKAEHLVRQAEKYVQLHLAEKITLDDVASHVFLSRFYFCKLFKQVRGENFKDYLTGQRILYAQQLLLNNEQLKTYEIAEMAGFGNARYFSQIFKSIVGKTPQEYKKTMMR